MQPLGGVRMSGSARSKLGQLREARWLAGALVIAAIGLAACGDDDDEPAVPESADASAQSEAPDLDQFLMRKGEEPGFRPGARPGALPRTRETIAGVEALVEALDLTPADARRLRDDGFISSVSGPIRGPRTAGITTVDLYETAEGAKHSQAHELRGDVIRAFGPVEGLEYFRVPSIPGGRGWTATTPHVGNVLWVQGRCLMVLGNQGPGPFAGPLSTGAKAIFARTDGECP
jgi:hypothetical protein